MKCPRKALSQFKAHMLNWQAPPVPLIMTWEIALYQFHQANNFALLYAEATYSENTYADIQHPGTVHFQSRDLSIKGLKDS